MNRLDVFKNKYIVAAFVLFSFSSDAQQVFSSGIKTDTIWSATDSLNVRVQDTLSTIMLSSDNFILMRNALLGTASYLDSNSVARMYSPNTFTQNQTMRDTLFLTAFYDSTHDVIDGLNYTLRFPYRSPQSGLRGLALSRTDTTAPLGITLISKGAPVWDVSAIDYQTNDLVLAYSYLKSADFIRMNPTNGQTMLAPGTSTPDTNVQFEIKSNQSIGMRIGGAGTSTMATGIYYSPNSGHKADGLALVKGQTADRNWLRFGQGGGTRDWRIGLLGNPYDLGFFSANGASSDTGNPGVQFFTMSQNGDFLIGTSVDDGLNGLLVNRLAKFDSSISVYGKITINNQTHNPNLLTINSYNNTNRVNIDSSAATIKFISDTGSGVAQNHYYSAGNNQSVNMYFARNGGTAGNNITSRITVTGTSKQLRFSSGPDGAAGLSDFMIDSLSNVAVAQNTTPSTSSHLLIRSLPSNSGIILLQRSTGGTIGSTDTTGDAGFGAAASTSQDVLVKNTFKRGNLIDFQDSLGNSKAKVDSVGNVKLGVAGSGFYVKEGTNATMGSVALTAGTAVVNTTKVTANSRIFLTTNGGTLTNVGFTYISARTAGTSFTITSSNALDASTVDWIIIEPN